MKTALQTLKDLELLSSTKELVNKERAVTMEVLRHLAEIERRKLYCDMTGENGLKYGSLFDYAVRELKYSEAAASRRIQALRLMNEIPELAPKIESGALNLSNVCRAQSFFRDVKRVQPEKALSKEEKKEVLEKLEQKSSREGERILLTMSPPEVLPRERERVVSAEHTEVRLILNQQIKDQLQEVRALMGQRGASLSLAELISEMAQLAAAKLAEKRFGKARVQRAAVLENADVQPSASSDVGVWVGSAKSETKTKTSLMNRYIPRAIQHQVWREARGQCASCGSKHKLHFDHVRPFALGGDSTPENLRLLCQSCNIRRGIKSFGAQAMKRSAQG